MPYLQAKGILPSRFQGGQDRFPPRRRPRPLGPVHVFRVRHDDALGGGHLRAHARAGRMERALVEIRERIPGRRAAGETGRGIGPTTRPRRTSTTRPAYYYNYAFATVLKFQLHDYIARKILHQPPQSCNYAGNKEVGQMALQHSRKRRDGRLAQSAEGRDRRRDFDPRDGGIFQAAHVLAGGAKQRPQDRLGQRQGRRRARGERAGRTRKRRG